MANREAGVGIIVEYNYEQQTVVQPPSTSPSPSISSSLDRFNIISQTWEQLTGMNDQRCGHAMFTYGDLLFAFGGSDGTVIHSSVEMYSIGLDQWSYKQQMTVPRMFFQSCEVNESVYIIGGITTDNSGNTVFTGAVEKYDLVYNSWTTLSTIPTGYEIAMGIAQYYNGNIYVLSGYIGTFNAYSNVILVYNISTDSWSQISLNDLELTFYQRIIPFSFVQNGYIYVVDGLYYQQPEQIKDDDGNVLQTFPALTQYLPDVYRFNLNTQIIDRGERDFIDIPLARYNGATVSIGDIHYFIGGINNVSNTLQFFESISGSVPPYVYTDLPKLTNGRSSLAASPYVGEYGDDIFVSGGTTSTFGPNFLQINLQATPTNVNLDGQQSVQVLISLADENNEAPSSVNVVLSATNGNNDVFIFTKDIIEVKNGTGIATLLPRSLDVPNQYTATISGLVIDATYFGDTTPATQTTNSTSNPGGTTTIAGNAQSSISLPQEYGTPITYQTVINPSQATSGTLLNLSSIGGFLSLTSNVTNNSQSATINYSSLQTWLPQVNSYISTNDGTYSQIKGFLATLANQVPWGGTPMYDAIYSAENYMHFDSTGATKISVVLSDGQDNQSYYTASNTLTENSVVSGPGNSPIIASIFRVVPDTLYLTRGIRTPATDLENLCNQTNGGDFYIISDSNISSIVKQLFETNGFFGKGVFTFIIDLGDTYLIDSLTANFQIPDTETSASWNFGISNVPNQFELTELYEPNTTATLQNSFGRYITVVVNFSASLSFDVYNAGLMVPPKFVEFSVIYNQTVNSYIFFNPRLTSEEVQQIMLTMDVTRPPGSEVILGVSDTFSGTWEDYNSPSAPAVENGQRVIFPIRQSLASSTYSLEPLNFVDGYVFEAAYGKWSNSATVAVYENGETLVDPSTYNLVPDKGRVVFSAYTNSSYTISITSANNLAIAAKITNRVVGDPVLLTGAGYMYSTLRQNVASNGQTILPQASNVLITPLTPNINSTFIANYEYVDFLGRPEIAPTADTTNPLFSQCTKITWYINNNIQSDLQNLIQWNNDTYQLVKSGDQVYMVIQPSAQTIIGQNIIGVFGANTRSLPVTIS